MNIEDNKPVEKAISKFTDIYGAISHEWNDDFKAIYEKEIFGEIMDCLENIDKYFADILENEKDYFESLKVIEGRLISESVSE